MFLAKYGSLALYYEYEKKIFIIDHKQLKFDKNDGWILIGIPDKTYRYLLDHEYFCIHDNLFDRIKSTHQDKNIMLKFISNEPNENESQYKVTDICDEKIQKKNRTINKKSTNHTIQRKRQKI